MSQIQRIESELSRRILISEKTRSLIMAWTLSAIMPCLVAFMLLAIHHMGVDETHFLREILALCLIWAGFEWWTAWRLGRAIRDGTELHRLRFYLNAMVEVAIPMVVVFIAADNMPPVNPINGPFVYSFFLFIILSPLRLDVGLCLFTGLITASAYTLLISIHWHQLASVWSGRPFWMYFSYGSRAALFAIGGIVAAFVTRRIRATLFETIDRWAERERIIGLFGQYVSPEVVNQLIAQSNDFTGQRSVCVLVFDIRNFTTFSEHRSAEEVVAYLNTLWGHIVRIINEHEGSVNKFLGDGFLAVFGAPVTLGNNAHQAFAAAQAILRKVDELVAEGKLQPTHVGMALHAGDVIAGEVGTSEKKEYAVIGDVVNVAFRIEALNKNFGSKLLISESVAMATGSEGFESLPPILVKGRDEPVALFKVA